MLDISQYPPAPVIWLTKTIDWVCSSPLHCEDEWRTWLPESMQQGLFSPEFRLGSPREFLLPMLSYSKFLQDTNQEHSLNAMKVYAFDTSSTDLADLTTPIAMVALLVLVIVLRRIKAILIPFFCSLGRKAGRSTHGEEWEQQNETRIKKFGEYVFRLVFHAAISVAGIVYFWDKEWWKPGGTPSLFMNYPFHEVAPGMIWYYLVQSAYNLEALLSLLELSFTVSRRQSKGIIKYILPLEVKWSESVRGDFREMFVHHVITNLLVIGSSYFRFHRIGSMVFLVHDISDVPVDLSKLANFLKWKISTIVCFASMNIVWLATRLGLLPFKIYRSVLTESWMVCSSGAVHPLHYVCYRLIFYVLIGLLILLHIIWFFMFIQMASVLIFRGEAHDLSEHKAGEDHSLQQQKNNNSSSKKTATKQAVKVDNQNGNNNKNHNEDDKENKAPTESKKKI